MAPSPEARRFLQALKAEGDPVRAAHEAGYHKSRRIHWGVAMPKIDRLIRDTAKPLDANAILALAEELWRSGVFDAMVAATRLLAHKSVPASPRLWRMIDAFMQDVDGWALEDSLARAAWKCIAADPALLDVLEGWTRHDILWRRRAALIFTLPSAKPGGDPTRMLGWMARYADDPEWFIQKAIGWWLRDLGQHDPDRVVGFLVMHWPKLRAVARKEATRRLPPEAIADLRSKGVAVR